MHTSVCIFVCARFSEFFFFFFFVGVCLVVRKIYMFFWILGCSFVRFLKHNETRDSNGEKISRGSVILLFLNRT
jgi:hypothetical protein